MLFFSGCSLKKETEITSEYIINQNWSKNRGRAGGNSIQIVKLKVKKDSLISPFKNLDQAELLTKLEHDSTFIYSANIKIGAEESYSEKKIYFDKDNGFYWWTNFGNSKTKTIGRLKPNSWYEFTRLKPYPYYIIYIDSAYGVHRFSLNQSNY